MAYTNICSGSAAVGWSGLKFQYWLPNAVNSNGAVSPATRANASSNPVTTPGSAVRKVMESVLRHCGIPNPSAASTMACGTSNTISTAARRLGRVRKESKVERSGALHDQVKEDGAKWCDHDDDSSHAQHACDPISDLASQVYPRVIGHAPSQGLPVSSTTPADVPPRSPSRSAGSVPGRLRRAR